jgi:GTP-dependent phosphoenolpyruvate carboxykinase
MTGLNLAPGVLDALLDIDSKEWLKELKSIKEFFRQFKKGLPGELWQEYKSLEERLKLSV